MTITPALLYFSFTLLVLIFLKFVVCVSPPPFLAESESQDSEPSESMPAELQSSMDHFVPVGFCQQNLLPDQARQSDQPNLPEIDTDQPNLPDIDTDQPNLPEINTDQPQVAGGTDFSQVRHPGTDTSEPQQHVR